MGGGKGCVCVRERYLVYRNVVLGVDRWIVYGLYIFYLLNTCVCTHNTPITHHAHTNTPITRHAHTNPPITHHSHTNTPITRHAHIMHTPQDQGLVHTTKLPRARFHEISESAVKDALESLTSIDKNMVNAYLARRWVICSCWSWSV